MDSWRASKKETEACADQFDAEFGMAYHERRMPEFLAEMADKYGLDRCKIVLASTIQLADHDGRYYPSTKADAAKTVTDLISAGTTGSDGTYVLTATVSNNTVTGYKWELIGRTY